MTPLEALLTRRIVAAGPITVADYMAECLLHPEHGYYTTATPFGAAGDFVTAPEISQMFGEMIGLCLAQCWLEQGAPAPVCLAELGPGRGTLMADIWRSTAAVPGFHDAARITLVEVSVSLRAAQAEALANAPVSWSDSPSGLPEMPLLLVANEFFDALPIRQFLREGGGWRERMVGLQEGRLGFGLAPPGPRAELTQRLADTPQGGIVEVCSGAAPVIGEIAGRLTRHGGAALILDYGDWRSCGDTLQAMRDHAPIGPLEAPGRSDLTAHVDFEALAQAATGASVSPMLPQGVFLERLGITTRAQALARGLTGPPLETHVAAHRRLTHPDEMGTLFKTLGITAMGAPQIPGLQPWP